MESWKGINYTAPNFTQWVQLMNQSTTEWGIGYLPPNLVALNDTLNNTITLNPGFSLPNNSYVIENAFNNDLGARPISSAVIGVSTGVAALWAIVWLWINWSELLSPRDMKEKSESAKKKKEKPLPKAVLEDEEGFIRAEDFKNTLLNFYYQGLQTEVELDEKNTAAATGAVDSEDVEAVTDLVRQMYGFDLDLWSHQHSTYISEEQRRMYRVKSDATLAEIRRIVRSWDENRGMAGWDRDEMEQLAAIVSILYERLPEKRYHDS